MCKKKNEAMAEIVWTEPALAQLDEIGDYIALDKPDAAKKLIQKIFAKVDLLEEKPKLGNVPNEIRGTPYRRLSIKPVLVYYRLDGNKVIIIFIRRGEKLFRFE